MSRRSDVFSSLEKTALPRYKDGTSASRSRRGKFVLLNMDAPHHTRLRKIISRGFTPRAVERLRDDLARARPAASSKAAAAEGSGDFVEQVSCELPLQAIAGLLGVPQEDRKKLFHWSNEMVGDQDPEFADIDPHSASIELIMYAMQMAAERAREPGRRHRHQADRGRRRRPEALRRRVRLLRHHAGGRRQRDHPQLDHPGHDGVRRHPRSVGAVQEGASRHRGRRDRPLGHAGDVVPAHRAARTTSCPACRSRRASGW